MIQTQMYEEQRTLHTSQYLTADQHLTADQIDEILIAGAASQEGGGYAGHLASCAACRSRLVEAQSPLSSLRTVAVAWSERRAATLPLGDLQMARVATRWRQQMTVATGLACALAVAVALPSLRQQLASTPTAAAQSSASLESQPLDNHATTAVAEVAAPPTLRRVNAVAARQQVARDNQMLASIHAELASDDESAAALGLDPAPTARTATTFTN